jgi:hypothetical protein
MAKAKAAETGAQPEVNKTQAIREYLTANPAAMPKAIAAELRERGYDVDPQRVSIVKSNMKKATLEGGKPAGTRRKKGGRPKAARAKSTVSRTNGDLSFQTLRKAKELSDQLGGVAKAKEALAALSQLTG